MPIKCFVTNCEKPITAKGLCNTHYKRQYRNGHIDQTRASDWGAREKHPMYVSWGGLRRNHKDRMPKAWYDDFWTFVREVPPRPDTDRRVTMKRYDSSKPWGPDNFYWCEPRVDPKLLDDRAAYMRAWQKLRRDADPDYERDKTLKRFYGVGLDWYKAKEKEQNGVCAICHKPETMMIKGKVVALSVDHCHDTTRVRGLLCSACNRALGFLRHDERLLLNAVTYLKEYR